MVRRALHVDREREGDSVSGSPSRLAVALSHRPQNRRDDRPGHTHSCASLEPGQITITCDDGAERERPDGEAEVEGCAVAAHHKSTDCRHRRSSQGNTDRHAGRAAYCTEDRYKEEERRLAMYLRYQCGRDRSDQDTGDRV